MDMSFVSHALFLTFYVLYMPTAEIMARVAAVEQQPPEDCRHKSNVSYEHVNQWNELAFKTKLTRWNTATSGILSYLTFFNLCKMYKKRFKW